MDEIEVEGLRIAYERAGAGAPLVLVHGFVGDGRSTWSGQLEALADEFTVIAWDAPGAGHSSVPPESFRVQDYAACLVAFLRALEITRAHLAGLSFGGMIVLAVLGAHPSLPRSLALLGTYAGWRGSLPPEAVEERLETCLRLSDLPPADFADAMIPSMFSASVPQRAAEQFAASTRRAFSPAGFRAMARSSAEADLRLVLPRVEVPTLLLYGDQDVRAPLWIGEALHSSIPTSRLVVMPGVGHVSSVEAPDLVNRELRAFLRQDEPQSR